MRYSSYFVIKTMVSKTVPRLFKKFPRRQPNTIGTDSSQSIYPCKHGARILPRGRKITTVLEDHFVSVGGVKIRYLEEGTGPTVVLIHGFGVSAETWRH